MEIFIIIMELYLVIPQVTTLRSTPRRKSTQTWLIKIFSLFVWLIRLSSNSKPILYPNCYTEPKLLRTT